MIPNNNIDKSIEFINNYHFPEDVLEWFDWHFEKNFNHKLTNEEINAVAEGLKDYFIFIVISPLKVAAASKLVDELFHTFILHTKDYADFCDGVGQFIHHFPIQKRKVKGILTDTSNIEYNEHYQSIIRTYCLSCQTSGLDPLTTNTLPYFFQLDSILPVEHAISFDLEFFKSVIPKLGLENFILEE